MSTPHSAMRLYSIQSQRLYLNNAERKQFKKAAKEQNHTTRLLCLTLLYTGCRVSEALNLRLCDLQVESGIIAITSLKKRDKHHVREVPVPIKFIEELAGAFRHQNPKLKLWSIHRTTAWRQVCNVMKQAGIEGCHATPKGLRHSFGVHCAFSNIAMTLCQKWMGHADIKTTAIYYQIVGKEELEMAKRMWVDTRD